MIVLTPLLLLLIMQQCHAQTVNLPSSFIAVSMRATTYIAGTTEPSNVLEGQQTVAGINAAFLEINAAGGYMGRNFTLVNFDTTQSSNLATLAATAAAYPGALAFLAPGYDTDPYAVAVTAGTGFPIIGGLSATTTTSASGELRRQVNLRTDFGADSFLLIKYGINSNLLCNLFGILYYDDPSVMVLASSFASQLESLYYTRPAILPLRYAVNATQFAINFTKTFHIGDQLKEPQCFALLSSTADVVPTFLALNASGVNPGSYAWLAPSVVSSPDWSVFAGFSEGWYSSFFVAHQFPNPLDTRYSLVARFTKAVQALFATGYPKPSINALLGISGGTWRPSLPGMEGYLLGRFFIDMVKGTNIAQFNRTAIVDTVYRQRLFTFDDLVLGPYCDGCVGEQQTESIYPCSCNAGTKKLFLSQVDTQGRTVPVLDDVSTSQVGISEQVLPSQVCGSAQLSTYVPLRPLSLHVSIVEADANALVKDLAQTFTSVMYLGFQAFKKVGLGNTNTNAAVVSFSTPSGFLLDFSTLTSFVPSRVHIQGATGMALKDDSILKNVTAYPVIAPMRFYFAEADDPIVPFAQWNPNYIPLFPTLTDFVFTAISWATSVAGECNTIVVLADTSFMVNQAVRACNTYQYKRLSGAYSMFDNATDPQTAIVSGTARYMRAMNAWTAALQSTPSNGYLVVSSQSAAIIQAALTDTTRKDIKMVIATSEFLFYDVLAALVNTTSYTPPSNVYYASGYPMNYFSTSTLDVVVPPIVVYAAITAGLVYLTAGSITGANTPAAFLSTLYLSRSVGPTYANVLVGPFYNTSCGIKTTMEHPGGQCQCSKGLTSFYIRSLPDYARLVANNSYLPSSSQLVYSLSYPNCAVPWVALAVPADLTSAYASIGTVLGIVIVGAGLAIILIRRALSRDNSAAPKDATKPFAIAFTDIQSSTTMWARAPSHMGPAVDLHHDVLRAAVKDFRGYEVKTIGDSFMVAFEKPEDAVRFAVGIQARLYEAEWNTGVFDETYKELIAEAAQKAQVAENDVMSPTVESTGHSGLLPGGKPTFEGRSDPLSPNTVVTPRIPTTNASLNQQTGIQPPEQYDANWCGLRVRVGVHYGTGSIKLDPVSQGYDYYGTVVNTAARVEGVSHGGQVCITQAVYDAISGSALLKEVVVTNLGPQPLRGLDEGVALHQVLPVRFQQRVFPPLRLDVEKEVEEDDASDGASADTGTVSVSASSKPPSVDELINLLNKHLKGGAKDRGNRSVKYGYLFLESLLATVRPKVQQDMLDKMSEAWRVGHLSKRAGMKRFRRGLVPAHAFQMTLIAYRVSAAADRSQSQSDQSDAETGTSGSRKDMRQALQFSTPMRLRAEAKSPVVTVGSGVVASNNDVMVMETPLAGVRPATEWEQVPGSTETPA